MYNSESHKLTVVFGVSETDSGDDGQAGWPTDWPETLTHDLQPYPAKKYRRSLVNKEWEVTATAPSPEEVADTLAWLIEQWRSLSADSYAPTTNPQRGAEGVGVPNSAADFSEQAMETRTPGHPGRRGYPEEKIARVLARVRNGEPKAKIARDEGISTPTIQRWLDRDGREWPDAGSQHEALAEDPVTSAQLDLARDLIDGARSVYLREQPRYVQLASMLEGDLRKTLAFSGVYALLQARTKDATSLHMKLLGKLEDRTGDRPSELREAILEIATRSEFGLATSPHVELLDKVPDLAAARILVFHPEDAKDLKDCISCMLPDMSYSLGNWELRGTDDLGGYQASHITGRFRERDSDESQFEIQVTSLLDFVSNAYSHEYAYKNRQKEAAHASKRELVGLAESLGRCREHVRELRSVNELPDHPLGDGLQNQVENLSRFVKERGKESIEARCAIRRWSMAFQKGLSDWTPATSLDAVFPMSGLTSEFRDGIDRSSWDKTMLSTFKRMEPKVVLFYLLAGSSELRKYGSSKGNRNVYQPLALRLADFLDYEGVLLPLSPEHLAAARDQ
jgi:ppGpp synthetase/RelA/SpoT-type nucleotidyltranferase/transposase-like protein